MRLDCNPWLAGQRTIPIEPLVGHLRHPEFHCLGKQRDTLERMFSASYILLPDARDLRLRRETSGRRLFFDAGASIYGTCALGCQKWFIESYRAKGIQFDRIIGWEMSAIDHERLWRGADGYPSAMHPRVTYYNTRAEADPTSGDNPLVHIAQIGTQPFVEPSQGALTCPSEPTAVGAVGAPNGDGA